MSEYYKDRHRYDDIMELPHHQSADRAHMSVYDRAAQFSPFAALSGHKEAIDETARLTEEELRLDEASIEKINEKLGEISRRLSEKPNVAVTYFRPDTLKKGGAYLTDVGTIKRIDEIEQFIIMDSGMKIAMEYIVDIQVC